MLTDWWLMQAKALLHNLNFRGISCYDQVISLVRSLYWVVIFVNLLLTVIASLILNIFNLFKDQIIVEEYS